MKISVTETSETTLELSVETPENSITKAIEQETLVYRKKIQIPGFRKGKAPLSIIRSQFGAKIHANAIESAVNEAYKNAIEQENLKPIAPGNISNIDYNPGNPLCFKAVIEIEPEFKVEGYEKITVELIEQKVTGEMLDDSLKKIQYRFATVETKEVPSAMGDHIVIDIQEFDPVTGVDIIGKNFHDRELILGDGMYGPDFDEQLTGLTVDDVKVVKRSIQNTMVVTPVQKAGKDNDEHLRVTVKKVESVNLPAIDEKLAGELEYKSVDDLKKGMEEKIQNELENNSLKEFRQSLENMLVEKINPPVPNSMVENYLHNLIENIKSMSQAPIKEDAIKEENRPFAVKKVQWYLIRQKLIEQEDLKVTDNEIDEHIKKFAEENKADLKRLQMEYNSGDRRQRLSEELRENKIYDFLTEKVKIKKVKR